MKGIVIGVIVLFVLVLFGFAFFEVPMVQTSSSSTPVSQGSHTVSLSCLVFHEGTVKSQASLLNASASSQGWSNNC